ncbi:MAG TPA: VWA domain-containing protein [Bryobacteraceae bacterium]|nr:VWA domain-containing protein [Bryobacteraceae bacterium]
MSIYRAATAGSDHVRGFSATMWCGIAILGAVLIAQDASVIRVPVHMVAVPTLVFSKDNRLIPGLKKADFRVLDNGVPQTIHLNNDYEPVSVVIVIQTNQDGRGSVPYISKVGSVMEAHLVGATGRAAVVAYNRDIKVLKPFGSGDVRQAFRSIAAKGSGAHMVDAGMFAIEMLKERKRTEARVLLFLGPVTDRGSRATWARLQEEAERENVSIYALNTSGGSDGAGSPGNPDFGWLTSMLAHQDAKGDPLSPVIAATGGTELHFHGQRELEEAIGTLGVELRSAYQLSYYPSSEDPGRHTISVEVSVPGAKTYARPGYILSPN